VRVDTGVEPGAAITPWYDPMIAKLIVRGSDRNDALTRMKRALAELEIAGLTTNVAFLRRLVASRAFAEAQLDTGLIETNRAELFAPPSPIPDAVLAATAFAELADEAAEARAHAEASGDANSPWHRVDGWRLNADSHHEFVFAEGGTSHTVRVRFLENEMRVQIGAREFRLEGERLADGGVLVRLDGRATKARALRNGADWHVFCDGDYRRLSLREELQGLDLDAASGSLHAPMPGRIIQVMAKAGDQVKKGAPLLILEAMKMEHTITAPADGVVKAMHFAAGDQVLEGAELVTLE
jgi:3-methylcrotonyl-CoA carboxylase alpha subunit